MAAVAHKHHFTPANASEAREMQHAVEAEKEEQDRRWAEARATKRCTLQVRVSGVCENNFFMGFSENISEGGVFIATMCPPVVGEVIDLSVAVSFDQALLVKGEVRWHRTDEHGAPTGCGVKFFPLSPEQEALITDAMKAVGKAPLFYDV
ncbi:MAG TPA: PilZ domain-containing protein [Myxococcota bacterium]|nr:PilZ domain-containing protein [Myxococcota bacterium]